MALGFSGSNGGISRDTNSVLEVDLLNRPLEVSYFVNNVCNLVCKHCYVRYEEQTGDLSIEKWKSIFDELIQKGALTFGNVGKEPLLSPAKTFELLEYFKKRREENPRIRFGLVTNGVRLRDGIETRLNEISPDYVDVSLDGMKTEHDYIRGEGNFDRTMVNLRELPSKLKEKVFISYTLMSHNKDSFGNLVSELAINGFKKFLISPYIGTPSSNEELAVANDKVAEFYQRIIEGGEVDFNRLKGLEILLKIDYDSQKHLMDELVDRGAIDVKNLLVDSYGVLFNEHLQPNDSIVVINYMPFSDTLSRAIRISHDGYLSGCLEMFHKDYQKRAKGNLKEKCIGELLKV